MAFPLIARCSVGLLFCLTALPLQSQSGHGFSVRERAGLVLVKPQPWSKDNDATLLEFDAFINRSADGGFGAGYYEFRTKSAGRRQIPRARIVKLVIYPFPEQFREIVTPEEREILVSKIDELSAAVAKFPASRNYLEPLIGKLADEVRRYDSGEVKTDGAWMPKDEYIKRLATRVAGQLKQDIARAKSSTDIDLEDDPSFAALKELAKDNSDARQLATDVSSQYETLLRAEKRRALLARLSKEQTSLSEAKAAVEELKMLRPQEDPKSAAFIRTWDSGLATIKAASIQTEKISHALEGELMPLTAMDSPPQISAELEKQIAGLSGMLTGFLATHPPLQFVDALKKDTAICAVGTDFRKLRTIFEEKHYIDAKDVLDNLALHADLVGPETARVVSVLQRQAIEKIEKFTRLRDEAKLLADSGKKPEALTKFEAAFIVIPDSDIEHQISVLKREVTEVSPKGE